MMLITTVYCFLFTVKKFHIFTDYLATAKNFRQIFATMCLNMALYKFFEPYREATFSMPLPDPNVLLSKEVDTETIKELNKN